MLILEQQYKCVVVIINQRTCDSLRSACRLFNFNYNSLYRYVKNYHSEFVCNTANNGKHKATLQSDHNRCKLKQADIETIKQLYFNKHLSMQQIAAMFDCSAPTICNLFSKHNITARTKSENAKWLYENNEQYREYVQQRNIESYLKRRKYSTKPEREFADFCKANNIRYVEQYRRVGNKHPYDFFLVDYNLLVEIDGTYWHSDPQQKAKDSLHVEQALKAGYNIVRIDTSELQKQKGDYWKWLSNWIP